MNYTPPLRKRIKIESLVQAAQLQGETFTDLRFELARDHAWIQNLKEIRKLTSWGYSLNKTDNYALIREKIDELIKMIKESGK
jgi:hypothetical protein